MGPRPFTNPACIHQYPQVQRAAAGALRTLAFKNEENKNLIVECHALPTLIQVILRLA